MSEPTALRLVRATARLTGAVSPWLASRMLFRLFLTAQRHKTPPREQAWLQGATRSELTLESGKRLPLWSWGEGPTVLLVHGWSGRGSQLAVFAQPLVEKGSRVVCFDMPGHGQADGKLTGLPEFIPALEQVATQEGPVHGIIAHSLGTAAVTHVLSRGTPVQRLAYLAPPDDPGNYLDRAAVLLGLSDDIARRAQALAEAHWQVSFAEADCVPLARRLDVPLLVVHDQADTDVPIAEGERLVAAWPGARLVRTEGLGHRRIIRDPDVVAQVVEAICGERCAELRSTVA